MPRTQDYRLRRYLFNAIPTIEDQKADGPHAAAEITRQWMNRNGSWCKETCVMIGLNARGRPVIFDEVAVGTLTACLVHPREIFRAAIRHGCHAILVAHTHPSGDANPSPEDYTLTSRIAAAGQVLGIPLLDHIVVTPTSFKSCEESTDVNGGLLAAEVSR